MKLCRASLTYGRSDEEARYPGALLALEARSNEERRRWKRLRRSRRATEETDTESSIPGFFWSFEPEGKVMGITPKVMQKGWIFWWGLVRSYLRLLTS